MTTGLAEKQRKHNDLIKKNAQQNEFLIYQQAEQRNQMIQAEKLASIRSVHEQLDHFNLMDKQR